MEEGDRPSQALLPPGPPDAGCRPGRLGGALAEPRVCAARREVAKVPVGKPEGRKGWGAPRRGLMAGCAVIFEEGGF